MNILKQGFIVLVAMSFLGAVSIGGAQAGATVNSSESNSSDRSKLKGTSNSVSSDKSTTINSTKGNTFKGKGKTPTTDSINLNSSRSNIY